MTNLCIVWFRRDLRLVANPALDAAIQQGYVILPVYIEDDLVPAPALNVFKHYALKNLAKGFKDLGLDLILLKGDSHKLIIDLVAKTGAKAVYWNRLYQVQAVNRDTEIKSELSAKGLEIKSFNGSLLIEPWQIQNNQGQPFKVFTAYHRRHLQLMSEIEERPLYFAQRISSSLANKDIKSLELDDLELLPQTNWHKSIEDFWNLDKGLVAIEDLLANFNAGDYPELRNRPDLDGVSKISPYLALGIVSPQMIYAHLFGKSTKAGEYIRQLAWRDFAYHLIYHMPQLATKPQRGEFNKFPWQSDTEVLKAWQQGRTGYPIVDAGMRELWATGWMHNRVRMIVASFLVKDLLIDWREGAKWFWHTLVDADLANNTMGWQWCAGCGVDAAPYFRIFNPVLQGEKFDPDGAYVRRWLPELAQLENKWIHKPFAAPEAALKGVVLGRDYPYPLVDHGQARARALSIYKALK